LAINRLKSSISQLTKNIIQDAAKNNTLFIAVENNGMFIALSAKFCPQIMSIIVNTNGDNRKIGTQHKASTASTIFA